MTMPKNDVQVPQGLFKKNVIFLFLAVVFIPYVLWGVADYVVTLKHKREAFAYFYDKDYATAYREIMPFAMSGDSESRYMIGAMTAFGMGTQRDKMFATQWFSCEGIQGCVNGYNEFRLAQGCFAGDWGKRSDEECILWVKLSSDQNYRPASLWLENYQKKKSSQAP